MTIQLEKPQDEERDGIVGLYLHGGCVAFARAAQRRTGWPAVRVDTPGGTFAHVGLRMPDGRIFDSRGPLSEQEFAGGWIGPPQPADLDALEAAYPYSEFMGRTAETHLHLLFPEFPGVHPVSEKLEAFAEELHELCRRHGIHIRPAYPHGTVLYPSYGDEAGYDIHMHTGVFTLERVLNRNDDDLEQDIPPKP